MGPPRPITRTEQARISVISWVRGPTDLLGVGRTTRADSHVDGIRVRRHGGKCGAAVLATGLDVYPPLVVLIEEDER